MIFATDNCLVREPCLDSPSQKNQDYFFRLRNSGLDLVKKKHTHTHTEPFTEAQRWNQIFPRKSFSQPFGLQLGLQIRRGRASPAPPLDLSNNNNNNLILILCALHAMIKRVLHDFYL